MQPVMLCNVATPAKFAPETPADEFAPTLDHIRMWRLLLFSCLLPIRSEAYDQ